MQFSDHIAIIKGHAKLLGGMWLALSVLIGGSLLIDALSCRLVCH